MIKNPIIAEQYRIETPEATFSKIIFFDKHRKELFKCSVLERKWLDNKQNISCIPKGGYLVKPNYTGKHRYFEITEVPNRTAIEIHPAGMIDHLQGCQSYYTEYTRGEQGQTKLTNSTDICTYVRDVIAPEGYYLIIM